MPGIQSTLQLSCLGSKKGRSRNFSQTQLSYYIHLRLLSGIAFDSIFNLFRASGIFQKTRNLVCISILKKVQWQLIFDALLLLNQKLLRKSLRLGFFFFISSGSRSSSSRQFEETRKCRYFTYKFFLRIHFEIVCGVSFSVIIFKSVLVSNQTDIWLSKIRRVLLINFFSHPKIQI